MGEIRGDLAAQQGQTEFARATRREWNKWALGQEVPTLAADTAVPEIPGQPLKSPASDVRPVAAQETPVRP
jgi:hypothetical protein